MQVESIATTKFTIVTICYAPLITQWLSENKFAWETNITLVMFESFFRRKKNSFNARDILNPRFSFVSLLYKNLYFVLTYISCFSNPNSYHLF